MAADSGGFQEATPAPGPGAESTTAQDATQGTGADASAQESEPDPFEADVQAIPEQQRDKFTSLLQHKKSLEKDLRSWRGLAEQYGDADAVAARLAQLDGLSSYATNDIGEMVIDQNTGLPQLTTAPWLQRMAEQSPGMLDQLGYDLWNQTAADGQPYGAKFFWNAFEKLGLDPNRVNEYAQLPASQVAASQPTADELQYIDASLHDAYRHLNSAERGYVQELIDKVEDAKAAEYLQAANKRMENEKRLEAFDNHLKQQEQAEIGNFWQEVNTSHQQVIAERNTQALAGLTQQIASQVQFSSDPTTNKIQAGMVSGLIAAMCSEQTRFAIEPILQELGATYDPQIDQLLQNATQAERVYQALSKVDQRAANNPTFAQYRNAYQRDEARRQSDGMRQQAMAKLAPIALKIAKAIATGNQGIREASLQDLAKTNSRPTVGNGAIPTGRTGQNYYPPGKEFDFNYRPQ